MNKGHFVPKSIFIILMVLIPVALLIFIPNPQVEDARIYEAGSAKLISVRINGNWYEFITIDGCEYIISLLGITHKGNCINH